MHVATGGVGGFFPDKEGGKPWTDSDPDAPLRFWEAKDQWYNTWERGDSALQVGLTVDGVSLLIVILVYDY